MQTTPTELHNKAVHLLHLLLLVEAGAAAFEEGPLLALFVIMLAVDPLSKLLKLFSRSPEEQSTVSLCFAIMKLRSS